MYQCGPSYKRRSGSRTRDQRERLTNSHQISQQETYIIKKKEMLIVRWKGVSSSTKEWTRLKDPVLQDSRFLKEQGEF